MINCSKCGKKLNFLRKKFYIYPAQNSKLELADEKVVCKDCHKKSGCEYYDNNDLEKIKNFTIEFTTCKLDRALKILESVSNKDNKTFWYNKGLALRQKTLEIASKKIKQVTQMADVKDKEIIDLYRESTKCFEKAILVDTHYTKAWYWRGRNLLDLKQFKESINCFENVIKLDCHNEQNRKLGALLFIGVNYLNLRNSHKAAEYLLPLFDSINHDLIKIGTFEEFLEYILIPSNFETLLEHLVQTPIVEISTGSGLRH